MSFLFYIEGVLTDQPINDKALQTKILRDPQDGAVMITQEVTLEWVRDNEVTAGVTSGYSILKTAFDDAICNELNIEIYDQESFSATHLTFTGVIKIPNVEFDEQRMTVKTKVVDNSFYAYVNNNKDLKVNLRGTFTKSKQNIALTDQYAVDLFNSNGCAYGSFVGAYFHGYLLQDVFSFIVRAITDNKVTFRSDYLDSLDAQIFILKGQDILTSYTIFPAAPDPTYELSFQQLFTEIDKLKNMAFYIDPSDPANPVLRFEDSEATYGSAVVYAFTGIKELRTYVDTTRLYAQVLVGSTVRHDGQAAWFTFPEATSYYAWKEESFFPLGQCNTNAQLNLVNEFVLSNNSIQDTGIGQSTSDIDKYFLIEADNVDEVALTAVAIQYDYFGQGGCFYNFGLNNYAKMQRHSNKFETAFGNFLGVGGNGFRALLGDTLADDILYVTGYIVFPGNYFGIAGLAQDSDFVNETTLGGYDGGNNYSNVTFEYTVPADGDYSFTQHLEYIISGAFTGAEEFGVLHTITLYDSGMAVKAVATFPYQHGGGVGGGNNGFHETDGTAVFNAVTGDIVKASYFLSYDPQASGNYQSPRFLELLFTSYFECNGTPDGGITITSGNKDLKKLRHEFTYYIDEGDWRTIQNNPIGMVTFEKDGVTRNGWIEEMTHDHQTGFTRCKLITNNAITTQ